MGSSITTPMNLIVPVSGSGLDAAEANLHQIRAAITDLAKMVERTDAARGKSSAPVDAILGSGGSWISSMASDILTAAQKLQTWQTNINSAKTVVDGILGPYGPTS